MAVAEQAGERKIASKRSKRRSPLTNKQFWAVNPRLEIDNPTLEVNKFPLYPFLRRIFGEK